MPALQASRANLVSSLKDGAPSEGPSRSRTRGSLLVAQVALSLVLLIGAGLLVRSLIESQSGDLGIDADRLLYLSVDLEDAGYSDAAQEAFRVRVMERLRVLPGVERVGATRFAPFDGSMMGMSFEIRGIEELPEAERGPGVEFVGTELLPDGGHGAPPRTRLRRRRSRGEPAGRGGERDDGESLLASRQRRRRVHGDREFR